MRSKAVKTNNVFRKIIAGVIAAAITLTAAAGFASQRVQAAEERIISDENAVAHINADGSGYIECKKAFDYDNRLTEIDGVALKDIITFNDGGYVDTFYTEEDDEVTCTFVDIYTAIYPYSIHVHGAGPEGFFSGSGYLHFTDESNDTYDLSIWKHSAKWHTVGYGSDQPTIVKISWNS